MQNIEATFSILEGKMDILCILKAKVIDSL